MNIDNETPQMHRMAKYPYALCGDIVSSMHMTIKDDEVTCRDCLGYLDDIKNSNIEDKNREK